MQLKDQHIKTVPALFRERVRRNTDKVALRCKNLGLWVDITWQTYFQQVETLAMGLLSLGLESGDKVAVIGDNCTEWVYIDLAVQCCGGITVGIYTTSSESQVAYITGHGEARFLFVENEEQLYKWQQTREELPLLEKVIYWDDKGLRHLEDPRVLSYQALLNLGRTHKENHPNLFQQCMEEVKPDQTAVMIYTSGTTGPPKGAMLNHGAIVWLASTARKVLPMDHRDSVLSFLPLCHIFERMFSVFGHLYNGYIVHFVEQGDTLTENLQEVSPTLGYGVPRIWEKYHARILLRMKDATWFKRKTFAWAMKAAGKQGFGRLAADFIVFRKLRERLGFERMKLAISGAAPISPEVLSFFRRIGVPLLEGYGQTESGGITSLNPILQPKEGTVGTPLPGLEVRLADDGEILVRSPGNFSGYYKNPQATAEALEDGWLHSGDVGRFDDDGYLSIVDRKKDLIITAGGKNIAPQHLENQLKSSPYINDAVVIGDRRKYLTALIMLDEEHARRYASEEKISFAAYAQLAEHPQMDSLIRDEVERVNKNNARVEHIRKFRILPKPLYEEDGEVTPTMKVKRKAVHEAWSHLIESMYSRS